MRFGRCAGDVNKRRAFRNAKARRKGTVAISDMTGEVEHRPGFLVKGSIRTAALVFFFAVFLVPNVLAALASGSGLATGFPTPRPRASG